MGKARYEEIEKFQGVSDEWLQELRQVMVKAAADFLGVVVALNIIGWGAIAVLTLR